MSESPFRKRFARFRARVADGTVRLTCFKSTPYYAATRDGEDPVTVEVRRTELPGFEFGQDYGEYFDGVPVEEAETVLRTECRPRQNRKFVLEDDDVSIGHTYAYWITSAGADRPVGPVGVRVRHPDVWWSWDRIEGRLDRIADADPDRAAVVRCGATSHGRRLRALRVGNEARQVALLGAIHGGESGPELLLPAVDRLLEDAPELLDRVGVTVLPSVNADRRQRQVEGRPWYLRPNPHGVDLNRNFDADWETPARGYGQDSTDPDAGTYRGPAPASEPETRAVVDFLETVDPVCVFAYHWMASVTGCRCLAPDGTDADYERRCRDVVDAFTRGVYGPERQPFVDFSASPGTVPAWVRTRFGVPAFDVEGHADGGALERGQSDRTTPEDVREWRDRHYEGLRTVLEHLAED